jgi:2-amino-4-hydroxy-6-hydroxymethyldihydropteridine diphosphokinase
MKTIYVALGSNLGKREENIAQAIAAMDTAGIHVRRRSALYETEPVGIREQGWFLNGVVEAETDLMPRRLLHTVRKIEGELGRKRVVHMGPRVIDLDVLLYGSSVVHLPELEIPHPRMTERRFVLTPLAELAAGLRHPVLKKTVGELLSEVEDSSQVRLWRG